MRQGRWLCALTLGIALCSCDRGAPEPTGVAARDGSSQSQGPAPNGATADAASPATDAATAAPGGGRSDAAPPSPTGGSSGAGGGPGTAPRPDGAADSVAPGDAPQSAGAWVPHFMGSGEIDDVLTGAKVSLPLERRIHVALLPEGWTQQDIDQGRFDAEVRRWWDEVVAIEPYATFREAFVIWKLPLASNARVTAGAVADTALRVPILADNSGVGQIGAETSALVWQALRDFPVPLTFYASTLGGRIGGLARNLVVAITIFNPSSMAAGYSGRTITAANPANAAQRVSVAVALGRAHEFTHAFARLTDEYMEDDNTGGGADVARPVTSASVSNVVNSAACATLPWSHLLPGTAINPATQSLVGAFGTPALGYHAELKCLMNGTHDNAKYYGGNGNLRSGDRMCNFCREVSAFRVIERAGVLADPAQSFADWVARYRGPFYARFGFKVPAPVPQTNNVGMAHFQACAP